MSREPRTLQEVIDLLCKTIVELSGACDELYKYCVDSHLQDIQQNLCYISYDLIHAERDLKKRKEAQSNNN